MANVTASMVKELREKTGAGMMDCKKALQECDGNMDKAIDYLREKGIADSAKKSGRIAAEGVVASYIHMRDRRYRRSQLRNRLCCKDRCFQGICSEHRYAHRC